MVNTYASPPSLGGPPTAGPTTRILCSLLVGTTLLACLTERYLGLGPRLLMFDRNKIMAGELWRAVTYMFVETQSPLALVFGALMLWLFGGVFERRWGSRAYLQFFLLTGIGGALLALPFGAILNFVLPFDDIGLGQGPTAAIDAMIVASAMTAPDAQVLFGFVLPIKVRHLILGAIGLQLIGGIMTGVASLGITLGGMVMGYLLVSGMWRPSQLLSYLKVRLAIKRRTRGLYVVPPKNKRNLN